MQCTMHTYTHVHFAFSDYQLEIATELDRMYKVKSRKLLLEQWEEFMKNKDVEGIHLFTTTIPS